MPRHASRATILLVDDDALITSSLSGLFALETDYEILAFNDPHAAAREAARRPIDVVISDFLMPGMNGVELLKSIREQQPEAVRILLTGFADKENAIRAINEAALYQYIEKPWDNDDLLLLLRNALSERNLRRQLSDKVHELDKLVERHTSLSDRHESVERELERAAAVQRGLLPQSLPQPAGYELAAAFEPSRWLGGDFYDAAPSDGDTLAVLLADVSGHGVHAALTSMLLKAVFRECVRLAASPAALLEEMNQRLYRYLPREMFVCATAVWIQPQAVCIGNGGLPYPFVVRNGDRLDELPLSGLPLGLFPDSEPRPYDMREIELAPGETLLLASDGLGEVRNAEGAFFQDDRLRAALERLRACSAEGLVQGLLEDAARFRTGDSWPDDVSLIAIRRV